MEQALHRGGLAATKQVERAWQFDSVNALTAEVRISPVSALHCNWEDRMAFKVDINGETRELDVPGEMPLLWALRNELGMVGTKFGCGSGLCGACTVHVDGVAQRSCSVPVSSIGEGKVTTIEGLAQSEVGQALQQAWLDEDVMQCGYCQAGQLMSASALLARNPKPDARQIDAAMSGNICRCACYTRIRDAIAQVADKGAKANA
jgi:isoquinoline 1-oxidoreductase alpha subunit